MTVKLTPDNNFERGAIRNEGVDNMCKAVEEYAKQYGIIQRKEGKIEGIIEGEVKGKIKAVKNMLKNGLDLEVTLKYADLDGSDYEKYSESAE